MTIENRPRKYTSEIAEKIMAATPKKLKMEIGAKMNIAARIDDFIEIRGLSEGEFAEKVGKNPSEISKWLSGTHNFTIETLAEIAFALDVNISDLFFYQEPKTFNQVRIITSSKSEAFNVKFLTPVPKPYKGNY